MIETLEDRVAKLLRLNVEEAVTRSADPMRAAAALAIDTGNQLIQLKTELVVAVAARHKLDAEAERLESDVNRWLVLAADASAEHREHDARQAAGEVVALRHQAAAIRIRSKDRHEQSERLRALFFDLQKQHECVERMQFRQRDAGADSQVSEVDRLLNELRGAKAES